MSNNLPIHKKIMILNMLCEGSSMRSISRVVDCSINTVTKLLVETGQKCEEFQYLMLRGLPCKRIEVDEIWAFCYGKNKKLPPDKAKKYGYGDIWTWTAVDPDSKIVICWLVGDRELDSALRFMRDVSQRVTNRVQITSDGYRGYEVAVEAAFGNKAQHGVLMKNYNEEKELIITKHTLSGAPDQSKISTSMVERQNLSIRMGVRRFTRRTNAHSKKVENHALALALYFFYHNFIRINTGLRVTPAMELGVSDHVWTWEEILAK